MLRAGGRAGGGPYGAVGRTPGGIHNLRLSGHGPQSLKLINFTANSSGFQLDRLKERAGKRSVCVREREIKGAEKRERERNIYTRV